jgi:hypothetical protein
MEISVTGIIIMALSMYGFFFNHKFLFYLNIFFIPFSATAILNIGTGDSASAIQAYMYLAVLNIILLFSKNFNQLRSINKKEFEIIKYFIFFIVAALVSIVNLNFVQGKFIGNQTGEMYSYSRIYFSSKNITQFFYLLLGFLFSLVVYNHVKISPKNFNMTLKIFGFSLIFVMFWGLFELFCMTTGLEYPREIFNNNANKAAQGIGATLDGGIKRMSSVATEASILAQVFVIYIPFLYYDYFTNSQNIFSKKISLILFLVFSLYIFLITSSSGIASLLVLYIIIGYLFITKKRFEERIIWFILVLLLILILVFGVYFLFTDIIETAILNKGDSASKLERSLSIESAWNNFLEYPLFGVGWGSVTSFDLFVRVLSNTGIIGGIIFIIFIFKIIKTHLNQRKLSNNYLSVKNINPAVITSFVVILFNNAISGFTFPFGHIWFVFGLSYVTYFRKNRIK